MAPSNYVALSTSDEHEDGLGAIVCKETDDEFARFLPNGSGESRDVIQFNAPIYYVDKDDGTITLDLIRIGNLEGPARVSFFTEDDSAKAGVKYIENKGEVVFRENSSSESLTVQLIQTTRFATTMEFKVHLVSPENCELGFHLRSTRVKIIDSVPFPSHNLRDHIQTKAGVESVNAGFLFFEFFVLLFHSNGLARPTCIVILLDQMKNVYLYFVLLLSIYLIDVVFSPDHEGTQSQLFLPFSRGATAFVVGIFIFVPFTILHYWDYHKSRFDLSGINCSWLRENLLRKYLNYSASSRILVSFFEMQSALNDDCLQLSQTYMVALECIEVVGKLLFFMIFFYSQAPVGLLWILFMPLFVYAWVFLRHPVFLDFDEYACKKQTEVKEFIQTTCESFDLITDYMQRDTTLNAFGRRLRASQAAQIPAVQTQTNNEYFVKWMGPLFAGLYVALVGHYQLNGTVTLGRFVTSAACLVQVSNDFTHLYRRLMSVHCVVPPLRRITMHLNLSTNLQELKAISRKRRLMTYHASAEILQGKLKRNEPRGDPPVLDLVPLALLDVGFGYTPQHQILKEVSGSVPQGSLVAIAGAAESGKATLLRLLGQCIFPSEGDIAIPPHLRHLYVGQQPVILDASAWHNLVYGRRQTHPERVKDVLYLIGLECLLPLVERDLQILSSLTGGAPGEGVDENDVGDSAQRVNGLKWYETVTHTMKSKIHLARAFIANPELLVLHRPFQAFATSPEESGRLMECLRTHVSNRGLALEPETLTGRRPNTVFFIAESQEQEAKADIVWRIDKERRNIWMSTGEHLETDPREIHKRGMSAYRFDVPVQVEFHHDDHGHHDD